MSVVIKIVPHELANTLVKEDKRLRENVKKAAKAASHRLVTHLVRKTDEMGITYQGIYKGGFRVTDDGVINDSPHAGLVELGARPHAVSKEGREAIKRWAMIKLGLSASEADSAAWGIANKIKKDGQEGRFVMRDAIPKAVEFYKDELLRRMKQGVGKKP